MNKMRQYEKAGRIPVCGKDMIWLTIIPDEQYKFNKSREYIIF